MRRVILFILPLGISAALVLMVMAMRGSGSLVATLPHGARVEILVNRPPVFEFMMNPADVQPAQLPETKR
ncbi:MAG TPA: hypothetical protein VGF13_11715 [Verrucomicrobiae bacterium]|jgi:hypothetical protein